MSTTAFANLLVSDKDGLRTIAVNRPKVLNALNSETVSEIGRAFSEARDDKSVRAVILTGAGEKSFIAGADINELAKQTPIGGVETSRLGQTVLNLIERLGKPVCAAINGYAFGGGLELALACHMRTAAETAKMGLPEVGLGIIPGYGGTQRLPRIVGKGIALELILSGGRIDAKEAHRIGLVNRVYPADSLLSGTEELLREIMSKSPIAVKLALEAVNSGLEMPLAEGLNLEANLFGLLPTTRDMKEGMTAFLEKRPAKFTGD